MGDEAVQGLCALLAAASIPAAGIAQIPLPQAIQGRSLPSDRGTSRYAEPQNSGVTEVEPLTVRAAVPVPRVGQGATYFSPEDLARAADEARKEEIEARSNAFQCRDASLNPNSPMLEENGQFSIQSLVHSEAIAQRTLSVAADDAQKATTAAIEARRSALLDSSLQQRVTDLELARQIAVHKYQEAQADVFESQARIADLQDQVEQAFSGDPSSWSAANSVDLLRRDHPEIRTYVDLRTSMRAGGDRSAGVYVPFEFKDLRFSNIVSRQMQENGLTVLRVTGTIVNTRKTSLAIPPIWVSAVDEFGTSVKADQATAARGQKAIKPSGSLAFSYTMRPMPEHTARTVVTFAPLHHPPRYKPIGPYCQPILATP